MGDESQTNGCAEPALCRGSAIAGPNGAILHHFCFSLCICTACETIKDTAPLQEQHGACGASGERPGVENTLSNPMSAHPTSPQTWGQVSTHTHKNTVVNYDERGCELSTLVGNGKDMEWQFGDPQRARRLTGTRSIRHLDGGTDSGMVHSGIWQFMQQLHAGTVGGYMGHFASGLA